MTALPRASGTSAALSRIVSALTLVLVATPACNDPGPTPVIVDVIPNFAYSDGRLTLIVDARDLRPSLWVDLDSESATFDRTSVHISLVPSVADGRPEVPLPVDKWLLMGRFLALMEKGVAAGTYDVKVVAPNGRAATSPAAFTCGGARPAGPVIEVSNPLPKQVVTAGEKFNAAFTVDDSGGQLTGVSWSTSEGATGSCPLRPDKVTGNPPDTFDTVANQDCTGIPTRAPSTFTESVRDFSVSVTATDVSGAYTTVPISLFVAQPPVITGFKEEVGRLEGKQPFTVTGRYFPVGSKVAIGGMRLLDPDTLLSTGGTWMSETTIIGLVPPSLRPNVVDVTVTTPWGAVGTAAKKFSYIPPPLIRLVKPPSGPAAGGISVTIAGNDLRGGVVIRFGATLDSASELLSATWVGDAKVVGILPPGQGIVSVWAVDPITGVGQASNAFTYLDDAANPSDPALTGDGGVPSPPVDSLPPGSP